MKKQDEVSVLFFAFVIGGGLLSAAIIIYGVFFYHPEGWQEGIVRLLQFFMGSGGLLFFIKQFQRIIEKRIESGYYDDNREVARFISGELFDYIKKRMDNLELSHDGRDFPRVTMEAGLSFLVSFLRKREPTAYYEVSIFWNAKEPDILCYVDSNGRNSASSIAYRKNNPHYYREKNYEVVKYLDDETKSMGYSVDIIHYKDNSNFDSATDRQKDRIRGQIFYRFSVQEPHVLVVTCNKPDVFRSDDTELKQVISTFGLILNSELILKEKFCCAKESRCKINENRIDISSDKIDYHEYMQMAFDYSTYSRCMRRQVGAVILCTSGRVFRSSNTPVIDPNSCINNGCIRNKESIKSGLMQEVCRCVHCEADLIYQCALNGESTKNSIIFSTLSPCSICAKALIRAQISVLVFHETYPDDEALKLLEDSTIIVKQV